MKGQASYPFSMFEAAFTFLLLISIMYGTQDYTETFLKQETAGAQADRVKNAAMAVDSYPRGYSEIPVSGYEYKVNQGNFTLQFRDKNTSVNIIDDVEASKINGSKDFKALNGLCIQVNNSGSSKILDFSSGSC